MQVEESNPKPELIIGLVGPIGVDMAMIQSLIGDSLRSVGYTPKDVRVTKLMKQVAVEVEVIDSPDPTQHYGSRIAYANAVREKCDNDAALAALAIAEISEIRAETNKRSEKTTSGDTELSIPVPAQAYVIRQLKRKEEIQLLRRVYGRKFIQVSINLDSKDRRLLLANRIASRNAKLTAQQADDYANDLVERDQNEQFVPHGQKIEDVFHLGDVFVSAKTEALAAETIKRFVDAFFGRNSISPTKDEYGTYMAASASLRSIDTSRQVGAAIFTPDGEVVAMGSNEVPAYPGGTYWPDHTEPHRDFEEGHDANHTQKRRILFDTLRRLKKGGFIKFDGGDQSLFEAVVDSQETDDSLLMDLTEFGRMEHAEMNALLDAARLGRPTKGTTLYCTTFPCHNCAKNIVAAGIERVVFVQPYAKSQVVALFRDSISVNSQTSGKVNFEHFIGISPRRYRDIFEKGKRRNSDGTLKAWYEGEPLPRVEDKSPYYVFNESSAVIYTLEKVAGELGIEIPD